MRRVISSGCSEKSRENIARWKTIFIFFKENNVGISSIVALLK